MWIDERELGRASGARGGYACLRVALCRVLELRVHEVEREFTIAPEISCARNGEQLLGWFVDAALALNLAGRLRIAEEPER